MNIQSSAVFPVFLVLFFFASPLGYKAAYGQCSGPSEQCSGQGGPLTVPTDVLIRALELDQFDDGMSSLCANDDQCFISKYKCAFDICAKGPDKNKDPLDCFPRYFDKYTSVDKRLASSAICSFVKSPTAQTRQALMIYTKDNKNRLITYGAYIMALNGNAKSCEDTIKNYVGPYGSKWNIEWYRILSGCRILAHERTREEEEKDFTTWFGVVRGAGSCNDIASTEMRVACSAPGANPMPDGNI
jgi:hypothetical protein